ncbi:hypothetical protein GCM10007205_12930 [Oxalicibacterium flavum]|uniref:ABC-2 type transporter transmembrane domain-containing protein n=1 Tax=Oxalicibacterium flavum TaxID=179467 RepID=A0A8J2XX45_9BURK|nr:ABC transporter permease [Oxalicibacterium flavum]GGC05155.1 hypothetical protein GCM10007205_12930 [Oxalicibacterium flavum]
MKFGSELFLSLREFPHTVSLAWVLAWRDFQARYIGSKAGYFWVLLSPALYGVAFIFVRGALTQHGVEIGTNGVNPVVFAFFGICLYQVWFEALTNQLNYLRKGSAFLKNMKIQPEIFAVSQIILSFLDLGVRIVLIVGVSLIFGVPPTLSWILSVFFMVLAIFTGSAIGYVLALPSSFYSDISKFISSISFVLLIGSPVFYQASSSPDSVAYWIQVCNPFAATLVTARDFMFGGDLNFLIPAIIWSVVLLILSVIMMAGYRIVMPLVMERL